MKNFQKNHKIFENQTALYQDFLQFEQDIAVLAAKIGIELSNYQIDHIALRVNSIEKAQEWLAHLQKCGQILSCNEVNERPIYLIELNAPLILCHQAVSVIELPYPKRKIYPMEGWEHIEIVSPFLLNESIIEWRNRLIRQLKLNQCVGLNIKISEPKVEGEQLPNPSIAVSLFDAQRCVCCVKLHPFDIKTVIEV